MNTRGGVSGIGNDGDMGGSVAVAVAGCAPRVVSGTADGGGHNGVEVRDLFFSLVLCRDVCSTSAISSVIIVACGK